jgi:hypothetical protein
MTHSAASPTRAALRRAQQAHPGWKIWTVAGVFYATGRNLADQSAHPGGWTLWATSPEGIGPAIEEYQRQAGFDAEKRERYAPGPHRSAA